MNYNNESLHEASRLISRHIDGMMSEAEQSRLATLMKKESAVVELYVDIIGVHGQLTWGAGTTTRAADSVAQACGLVAEKTKRVSTARSRGDRSTGFETAAPAIRRRRNPTGKWLIPMSVVMMAAMAFGIIRINQSPEITNSVASPKVTGPTDSAVVLDDPVHQPIPQDELSPPHLEVIRPTSPGDPPAAQVEIADAPHRSQIRFPDDVSDEQIIAAINGQISKTLVDNEMEPSPRASSEEWTRRAFLTVAGRIPSVHEAQLTLRNSDADSRAKLIEQLLDRPDRSRRLAEVWGSLLVGRSGNPQINRQALQEYLYSAFNTNEPWITMVGELISAEGRSDENGATNFLLAHLDNQATPATAVTSRLFLGEQLQCVQCHDHPFAGEVEQGDYWSFNAFFKHTDLKVVDSVDSTDSASTPALMLTDREAAGMTFYETWNGQQEAVVPSYDGRKIPATSSVPRRAALAEYLATDSRSRVARAMVNRIWANFFGYGFTNPIDDMGPHATISHPELFATLTDAFVASGYDLRRLQKWIALSDAWQCTSQATEANELDAPEAGEVPLFSRVYVRRMAPEQVYDSIRVAIRAVSRQVSEPDGDAGHRREWVNQFVRPYNTDENDEADEFNGSITQAMVMMNGPDVNSAIRQASETLVTHFGQSNSADSVLEQVSLAVLTRHPTESESKVFRQRLLQLGRDGHEDALVQVTEDMLWAYLNSSEFLLIH